MSLRRFLRGVWDDPWEGMTHPSLLYDQHFGNVLRLDSLYPRGMFPQIFGAGGGPVSQQPLNLSPGFSEVMNTETEFRVSVDVQHFLPDEITIKTKDNRVIIHAKHEEQEDEHGYISREFTRQIILPKDVDPAMVTSSLCKGILTVKSPKKALEAPKERFIPIAKED